MKLFLLISLFGSAFCAGEYGAATVSKIPDNVLSVVSKELYSKAFLCTDSDYNLDLHSSISNPQIQVVAGLNYKFSMDFESCGGVEHHCNVIVFSQVWTKTLKVTSLQCTPQKRQVGVPGGVSSTECHSAEIQKWIPKSVETINSQANSMFHLVPVSTTACTSQVVAGMKYTFNIDMMASTCMNNQEHLSHMLSDCPLSNTDTNVIHMHCTVVSAPWKTPKYTINCAPVMDNPQVVIGGDGHDLKPHTGNLGGDGHDLKPHGNLGGDGHDLKPHGNLGGDGHDLKPHTGNLGGDGHDLKPHGILGGDGHDLKPHTGNLGDGHDLKPHTGNLGGDGHDLKPHTGNLGGDGHDLKPHGLLGGDGHDLKPHTGNLGGDGHDFCHIGMFKDFQKRHKKFYSSQTEEEKRSKIFCENMRTVQKLQETERGTAQYGATKFADLTEQEFKSRHVGKKWASIQNRNSNMKKAYILPRLVPESFDWREHNAVTEVKNQGSCGSCWAFSTTGNIEGQWAIQKKELVSLSEQELVDCDKLDQGCEGGLPSNAYKEIERLGGLETEYRYKYDGADEKCVFNRSDVKVFINDSISISSNETEMAVWLFENGPISIGINAFAMQFYMGGISHPWKIFCNPKELDHGVLIVGYGVDGSKPYWIVKNSWGPDWGEKGYYLVYRGAGVCGLNTMCTSAIVK